MTNSILIYSDGYDNYLLEIFLQNCHRFQPNLPVELITTYGGIDPLLLNEWSDRHWLHRIEYVSDELKAEFGGWFMKPYAMSLTKFEKTLYLDIDIHFQQDIVDIFRLYETDKIGLVEDQFFRRHGQNQYNTGVILYSVQDVKTNQLLQEWQNLCADKDFRGDQDALIPLVNEYPNNFNTLPDKYNYVRLEYQSYPSLSDLRIIHFTGPAGKRIIKERYEKQQIKQKRDPTRIQP